MSDTLHYRDISEALPHLMDYVLGGAEMGSRNGVTKERTFVQVTLEKPWQREILHPLRRASLPAQIAETVWVLSGRDDVKWLSHYLPRAKDFSDDGERWRGAYGPRLRAWPPHPTHHIDQLAHVVQLLREDPATRRAVMAIYDPAVDAAPGKDIPCNNWIHFLSRMGKLDAHVAIRSNDLMWGWSGINAFEWSTLLEVVAALTGLQMGQLHFSISSLHLYGRHWEKAQRIAAITDDVLVKPVRESPRFGDPLCDWHTAPVGALDQQLRDWFRVEERLREHPDDVGANLPLVSEILDPMLRSWLRVLGWWWSGDERYLDPLLGTPLYVAALKSPGRPTGHTATDPQPTQGDTQPLADLGLGDRLAALHAEKHAAYGDSWKKRGELLSILPNIARKVDRLEGGQATQDENQLDTAGDLLVYLIKYRFWIYSTFRGRWPLPEILRLAVRGERDKEVSRVKTYLYHLQTTEQRAPEAASGPAEMREVIVRLFNDLTSLVERDNGSSSTAERAARRAALVDPLIQATWTLARQLDNEHQRELWKAGNATRRWQGYDQ